jgi:uncharacterized membrane protein
MSLELILMPALIIGIFGAVVEILLVRKFGWLRRLLTGGLIKGIMFSFFLSSLVAAFKGIDSGVIGAQITFIAGIVNIIITTPMYIFLNLKRKFTGKTSRIS